MSVLLNGMILCFQYLIPLAPSSMFSCRVPVAQLAPLVRMALNFGRLISLQAPSLTFPSCVEGLAQARSKCGSSATVLPLCAHTQSLGRIYKTATMKRSVLTHGRLGGRGCKARAFERAVLDQSIPDSAPHTQKDWLNGTTGNSGIDQVDLTMEEGRWQSSTAKFLQEKRNEEAYQMYQQVLWQRMFEAMFIVRAKRCSSFEREAATSVSHLSELQERQRGRRQAFATILLVCTVPIVLTQMAGKLLAEEAKNEAANNDQSIVGGLLSLFDPNETTKQGKKLPKAYLKSAREVVQTLRASFSEDSKNDAKFRRNADSAKGAIRDYISNWRGAKLVDAEDSYQALERALRILSEFYSKKGPSAALPEDVRGRILDALQKADDAL